MVVPAGQSDVVEVDEGGWRPGDRPWMSDAEFAGLVQDMVTDEAPRMFAVVQDANARSVCGVVAWGLQFEGAVEIVGIDGRERMRLRDADRAVWIFSRGPGVNTRLVWVEPAAAGC